MFLKCIEADKFFQNLFLILPGTEKFELHKMELDIQNDRLKLFLQTDLLPSGPARDNLREDVNCSAIEIDFFFLKDFLLKKERMQVETLKLGCDIQNKKICGSFGGEAVLSFQYELAKLSRWDTYHR